ncbi:hypothetical protein T06_249 [Trichinella sp. T6]|nr:hypothetical protein T06_249 [Trichinella sp. T6]
MPCRREKGIAQIPYAPGMAQLCLFLQCLQIYGFPKVPWDVTTLEFSRLESNCFSANRRGVDGSGKQIAQP